MGKHKVTYDDYDEKGGGAPPPKGIHDAALIKFEDHTAASSGADGFKWTFQVTRGSGKGWMGYVYSNMDSTKWRTQQIVKAIRGGSEEEFTLDTSEAGAKKIVKNAQPVRVRTILEDYEGEDQGKIRTVMPGLDDDDAADDSDDAPKSKKKKKDKKGKSEDPWAT